MQIKSPVYYFLQNYFTRQGKNEWDVFYHTKVRAKLLMPYIKNF